MTTCKCSGNSCSCDNKKNINEHLKKILYKTSYKINEANYTLIQDMDEDDSIPDEIWSEEEPDVHEDAPIENKNEEEITPEEEIVSDDNENITVSGDVDVDSNSVSADEIVDNNQQQSADEIQNNIIKSSISAMQKMNSEIDRLGLVINSLNGKIDGLNQDVEEVREPTNVEKLTARKQDSHPFYYNLNDMWEGNWFQARREVENEKGIRKLEDGSYIADFDSLPKYSDQEIKDSFNK